MNISCWLTDFPLIEHREVMIIDLNLGSCVPNLGMFSNSELVPLPLACEFWKEGHNSQATYILFGPYTPENCDLGTNWVRPTETILQLADTPGLWLSAAHVET